MNILELDEICVSISHIDVKFYTIDKILTYDIIPSDKHLTGKSHNFTVERMNRFLMGVQKVDG